MLFIKTKKYVTDAMTTSRQEGRDIVLIVIIVQSKWIIIVLGPPTALDIEIINAFSSLIFTYL